MSTPDVETGSRSRSWSRSRERHGTTAPPRRRAPGSRIPRADLIESGLLAAILMVALSGLTRTFTGSQHLAVSAVGVALGIGLVLLSRVRRWPVAVPVLLALLALALLGPALTLRSLGGSAALPTPGTLRTLIDQTLGAPKDLLTTLPPVDGDGPLLVLPLLLGLLGGLLGSAAIALRRPPASVQAVIVLLAPLAVLATVILLGVSQPASLLLQGVVFAVLALGLAGLRAARGVVSTGERAVQGRNRRLAGGVAMVLLAGALAWPVGSWAVGDEQRLVLRDHVEPPFDVGRYPSPLSSFRRYVEISEGTPPPTNLYEKELLRVEGAPEGTRLRFAALDHYDGIVWGAGNRAAGQRPEGAASTSFQRVSQVIDNPAEGERIDLRVTLGEGYEGVWLPGAGRLQTLHFDGERGRAAAEAFRYNLATSTGVVPGGLRPGDSYRLETVLDDEQADASDQPAQIDVESAGAASFLDTQAVQWTAGVSQPMERVFAAAEYLRTEGKYTDGVRAAERIYPAGHHRARLLEGFAADVIMAGNDEQYAATMALLANAIGVPARVVMGARVPADGVVRGSDVEAWVELQVDDGGWRTLPTELFMGNDRPAERPPLNQREQAGTVVPPPAPIPPPSTLGEQTDAELDARRGDPAEEQTAPLPGWAVWLLIGIGTPLLIALLVVAAIVGVKALRRRRRRTAASISQRCAGAWRELVDQARDLGQRVPAGGGVTRGEQSGRIGDPQARSLARAADGRVFGAQAPGAEAAAELWRAVDEARARMRAAASRRSRARAAVSLRSLRRR